MNFSIQTETTLLACAVAAACAVPGVFLVLRRMAMVGDAISHVLLFGIAVAYFVVPDLYSPWLMIGATLSGVFTVALVELLQRTRRVAADAAIGLVFPALFALGTVLVSIDARDVHLDVDAVLLGQIELLWVRERVVLLGQAVPLPTLVAAGLFLANAALIALFYKELKLSTFDAGLAATLGFLPGALHYGLMTMVSLTAVASFDAVGPVMVVAFLIVPAATAYLLTDRLSWMLVLSVVIGLVAAIVGVAIAYRLNTNIAGTVASVLGLLFGLTLVFAPGRGLLIRSLRRWRQHREFFETALAIHLRQHEGTPEEPEEARIAGLHEHLLWSPAEVARVMARAERNVLVVRAGELLKLTEEGRSRAREVLGA